MTAIAEIAKEAAGTWKKIFTIEKKTTQYDLSCWVFWCWKNYYWKKII